MTLTIALEKVAFLPPTRVTDDTSVLTLKNLVFEPLLKWDKGFARPALFAAWRHGDGGRAWRFTIRDGATFHDGKPAEAEDVVAFVAAILEAVDTFGMKWSYARYLRDATVTAVDARTVAVANPTPLANILDIFCEFHLVRLDASGAPILGTGRYRVADLTEGRARLTRVAATGGPAEIVAVAEPSAERRLALIRDGAVDAALNLERGHGRLVLDPALSWRKAVNTLSVMAYLKCAAGLFAAPEARLAVNHAIDKRALVEDVFLGLAVPAATIVSPYHLGMAAARLAPIAYDPAKARALLDAVAGASSIVLRTPTFMPERAPETARFIAQALGAVGLAVDIDVVADRPDYARQVGGKNIGDMAIFDSSPASTFRVLDDKISARQKAVWWQGFDDAETEARIAAASAVVADSEREAAYAHVLARLNTAPPWLYLVHPVDVLAHKPDIAGLAIDPRGTLVVAATP
jgi:peptide/nickel transport system substrate-binding protein